jgi:uncharacterized protein YecE (DUF72 family)
VSRASLRLGTSGFVYREWRGLFYPPQLPGHAWLSYYARVFPTVELNNTFYRLTRKEAVARWKKQTPSSFRFVAKGSRFITHMKRLREPELALERFFTPLQSLGRKLEAVLWQLPPQWTVPDPERLDRFLRVLPRRYRTIVEFRHPAWHHQEILSVLDAHGAAVCEHDLIQPAPPRTTGGFRYLRFHGTSAFKYSGLYGKKRLRKVARSLEESLARGEDAYVYFNNDRFGHALLDALTLSALLGNPLEMPEDATDFLRGGSHRSTKSP